MTWTDAKGARVEAPRQQGRGPTTPTQVATNATVLRGLADVLTRWGLADEHDRAAWIANYLHREGWRHIEAVPALHGPSSTEAGRAEARRIYELTRNARTNRVTAGHVDDAQEEQA